MYKLLSTAAAAVAFFCASTAGAITITPVADVFIQQSTPDTVQNTDRLRVRSDNNNVRIPFVLFEIEDATNLGNVDLSQLIFSGVTGANGFFPNTLNLYGFDDGSAFDNLTVSDVNGLTYNQVVSDLDGFDVGDFDLDGADDATLLATLAFPTPNANGDPNRFTYANGFPFAFDSDAIANFIQSDSNGQVLFAITYEQPSGSSVNFASLENQGFEEPRFVAVPAPASSLLLLLGCAGLLSARRQRKI